MPGIDPVRLGWFELGLFGLIAIVGPLLDLWLFTRLRRATARNTAGARARYYVGGMIWQWGLVALLAWLWISGGRSTDALHLGSTQPLRHVLGAILAGGYVWAALSARRRLLAQPEKLSRLMASMHAALPLLPHTRTEARLFAAVAITAGITEEVLFRGFTLLWATSLLGPIVGFAVSTIAFGLAHLYLGREHVIRTTLVGALLAVVVLVAGNLWPAIVIHATMDLCAGELAYLALTRAERAGTVNLAPTA
ncbi:MAG: CPBP family intramembrane glutamic endopeptidase [Candidatus Eisenbacteria bacterium]